MIFVVLFGTLASIALGFILCIGVCLGGVFGLIDNSNEVKSWIAQEELQDMLNAWTRIEQNTSWIPGTRLGRIIGTELAKIIDE